MAASMVIGVAFDQLLEVARETAKIQSMLKRLESILTFLQPGFMKIQELHHILGSPKEEADLFLNVLEDGKRIVIQSSKVRWWDLYSKYRYSRELRNLENKIVDVMTQLATYNLEILGNQKREIESPSSSCSSPASAIFSSNPNSSFNLELYQQLQDLKDFCKPSSSCSSPVSARFSSSSSNPSSSFNLELYQQLQDLKDFCKPSSSCSSPASARFSSSSSNRFNWEWELYQELQDLKDFCKN